MNPLAINNLVFSGAELLTALEASLAFLATKRPQPLLSDGQAASAPAIQPRSIDLSPIAVPMADRGALPKLLDDAFKAYGFCEQERAVIVQIACEALSTQTQAISATRPTAADPPKMHAPLLG